jgi:GDPmannose 4,6-dehydratase
MSDVCLIFGGNSQDGYYLAEQCLLNGMEVISVSRTSGNAFGYLNIIGDVSEFQLVADLINKHKPLYIFHLAANSTTRHDAILENYQTICIGTCNILESVKLFSPTTRVFITGSGLQFQNKGQAISEHDPFVSDTAYSMVRNSSVECARYYRSLGIAVYIGYLFHHESPLRKPSHVSKMIALAAQRIALGSNEKLNIGDVSVKKEWGFAGDIARGIVTLISQDHVLEAVIGTGEGHTIKEWLNACFSVVNLDWKEYVNRHINFTAEYSSLISDPHTMFKLGWCPLISFDSLATLMMNHNN